MLTTQPTVGDGREPQLRIGNLADGPRADAGEQPWMPARTAVFKTVCGNPRPAPGGINSRRVVDVAVSLARVFSMGWGEQAGARPADYMNVDLLMY
jgi:hypothetical protein